MAMKFKVFAAMAALSLVLGACGKAEESANKSKVESNQNSEVEKNESAEKEKVEYADVFTEAVTELEKAKEGKKVDFDKVTKLYNNNLKELVQNRDAEFEDTVDEKITAALTAGKDGSLDPVVVKQVFDKLMQKVFYTSIKHDFTEVADKWGKTEEVNHEIEEAKEYYAILKTTVEKRDAAYGTNLVSAIDGGFNEIETAVKNKDELGFNLGKQVVDKTLMKTFYLATGALPNGYATKAANEAKKDEKAAKVEQAEGWAFFQSVYSYLNKHAADETAFIEKQFNLESNVSELDPAAVNKAFVRGFAKIAISEYGESKELLGKDDKAVVTGLEGALFIDIIGEDIKTMLGEDAYKNLNEKAHKYVETAKAKDKAAGEAQLKDLISTLNTIVEKAK
ncbi:hypothetical protein E2K98_06810 [Bacillus salipaludis]|uniref:DUF3829 domain-containing protein n=1 Tax=Bacillus salipaludis TaxID=2547811 RepID=A0A4R5VVD2_9BACI|nr:hypothetical protein [Bacillus salipaludis]TDK63158.1 hypothetical protein E2K98_06810 [Bacillus salipaludis]